jgi:hypothetical protein
VYAAALGTEDDDVNRRMLLMALATMTLTDGAARLIEGLTAPVVPSRVGMSDVDAVREAVRTLTATDLRLGGGCAATLANGLLTWTNQLVSAEMTPPVRRALSTHVAALADRASWVFHDVHRLDARRRAAELAILFSHEGEDPTLYAHVMLNAASYLGETDPGSAAAAMRRAVELPGVHPLEMANLLAVRARHFARAGRAGEALLALAHSEEWLATEASTPIPDWAPFLSIQHVQQVRARSFAAVEQPEQAAALYRSAVAGYGPDRTRGKTKSLIRYAELCIDTGDRHTAERLLTQAEGLLGSIRSDRTGAALTRARHRLGQTVI